MFLVDRMPPFCSAVRTATGVNVNVLFVSNKSVQKLLTGGVYRVSGKSLPGLKSLNLFTPSTGYNNNSI